MKQHMGVWLPDHEKHLLDWMSQINQTVDGKGTYQLDKQNRCYQLLMGRKSQFRIAIDVGAHVGLWSMQMVKHFRRVEAFEPMPEHAKCFKLNLSDRLAANGSYGVVLHTHALGAERGVATMLLEDGSSGNTRVNAIDNTDRSWLPKSIAQLLRRGDVEVIPLDEVFPHLQEVDFIKIDCEGYEYFVLQGAENLIKRNKPVVMVEQKRDHGSRYGVGNRAAVELLESWGAKLRFEISGDYCLAW